MKVRITLDIDVGEDPTADGITYMIGQYTKAEGDNTFDPEEWAEEVVLDILRHELEDHDTTREWTIEASDVIELVDPDTLLVPASAIPFSYSVQPLRTEYQKEKAKAPAQCGTCGLWWDDAITTGITPVPSGRCPFEQFHR